MILTSFYDMNQKILTKKGFPPKKFSFIPLGEMYFLEENYKNMQKNQMLTNLRAPSI